MARVRNSTERVAPSDGVPSKGLACIGCCLSRASRESTPSSTVPVVASTSRTSARPAEPASTWRGSCRRCPWARVTKSVTVKHSPSVPTRSWPPWRPWHRRVAQRQRCHAARRTSPAQRQPFHHLPRAMMTLTRYSRGTVVAAGATMGKGGCAMTSQRYRWHSPVPPIPAASRPRVRQSIRSNDSRRFGPCPLVSNHCRVRLAPHYPRGTSSRWLVAHRGFALRTGPRQHPRLRATRRRLTSSAR